MCSNRIAAALLAVAVLHAGGWPVLLPAADGQETSGKHKEEMERCIASAADGKWRPTGASKYGTFEMADVPLTLFLKSVIPQYEGKEWELVVRDDTAKTVRQDIFDVPLLPWSAMLQAVAARHGYVIKRNETDNTGLSF